MFDANIQPLSDSKASCVYLNGKSLISLLFLLFRFSWNSKGKRLILTISRIDYSRSSSYANCLLYPPSYTVFCQLRDPDSSSSLFVERVQPRKDLEKVCRVIYASCKEIKEKNRGSYRVGYKEEVWCLKTQTLNLSSLTLFGSLVFRSETNSFYFSRACLVLSSLSTQVCQSFERVTLNTH